MGQPVTTKPCKYCGKTMENVVTRQKFCNNNCRSYFHRNVKKKIADRNMRISAVRQTPEHVKDMIYLAFGADTGDVIREVLREEIRENITQAVQDNVLGAAEVLAQALPKALAGVIRDLDNQDYYVRGRAQQLVFKYAMPFLNVDGKDKDLGTLTVKHGVQIPDTKLGVHVVQEVEAGEDYIEEFEKDWPSCESCKMRKHPDAMYTYKDENMASGVRWLCKTCRMRKSLDSKKREDYAGN